MDTGPERAGCPAAGFSSPLQRGPSLNRLVAEYASASRLPAFKQPRAIQPGVRLGRMGYVALLHLFDFFKQSLVEA